MQREEDRKPIGATGPEDATFPLGATPTVDSRSPAPPPPTEDASDRPERIGAYRLIRVLGEGGFGSVYLAQQASPNRQVAVKVLRAGMATRQALARFEHEAQTLARLQHPGIAQVFEAGFYDVETGETAAKPGTGSGAGSSTRRLAPFFAMEFIQGVWLTGYAAQAGLKARDRVALLIKVCEAVQHAHNQGVIHRDLKPGNILVDQSGQPKVLDFGVARVSDGDIARVTARTDVGQMVGTLPYMSPEQVAADPARIDTRSDVYALGVVLFELLTGRLPYVLDNKLLHEATRTICEAPPERLGTVSRVFRGDLETIVGKALEKDRDRRYDSAAALAEDLRRYLKDEPIVARPPSTIYQWQKFARRNKTLVGGIAATMLVLAAGVAVASTLAVKATHARDRARLEADKARAAMGFLEETLAAADPARKGKDVKLGDVLDGAAADIETTLADSPEVAATVHVALARAYKGLGNYDKGLTHAQKAVDNLGAAARGPDDADVLEARTMIAQIQEAQSKFTEAEIGLKKVHEAKLRIAGGQESVDSLQTISEIGRLYAACGKLPQSEAFSRRALEGFRRFQGDEGLDTVAEMQNLAETLATEEANHEASKGEEADRLFARVLEIRTRTLKPEDKKLERVRAAAGNRYMMLGQYDAAADVHRVTLMASEKKYGPEHPRTLTLRNDLGTTLQKAGRLDEAEKLLSANFETLKRVQGPDDFDTLTCAAFLADTYLAQGKLEEAEVVRRHVAESRTRTLGPEDSQTLIGWTNLSLILIDEKKYDDARAVLTQLLATREHKLGPEHNEVGLTLSMLGLLGLKQGDGAAAEAPLRRSLAIREKLFPEGNGIRGITMSGLGHALTLQGKYREAEPLVTKGAEWVLADPKSPGRNRKDAAERAATLYEKWGKAAEAAKWRERMPK